jgi:FMN phosphatase YigB (HAD superfamily)
VKSGFQESAPGFVKNAGAFIVDFDGSLYDPKHFVRRLLFGNGPVEGLSLQEIRLIAGERKTRKEFAGCDYGNPEAYYEQFFAALERRARFLVPAASWNAAALRRWYFDRYIPRMTGVLRQCYAPRPGAAEFLQTLERGKIPHAVYPDYPCVRERLEAIGLDPGICGQLFGPEHFGAQKPAAAPFLSIAAALNCAPNKTLVIGDKDSADGAGAKAAGMMYLRVQPKTFEQLAISR